MVTDTGSNVIGLVARRDVLRSMGLRGRALDERGRIAAGARTDGTIELETVDARFIQLPGERHHPGLMAMTPNRAFALVPLQDANELAMIDTTTHDVAALIPLRDGDAPWDVAVRDDGTYAFVTNSAWREDQMQQPARTSTVSVVDLTTRSSVASIPVGAGPNGIGIVHRLGRAFVANARSHDVTVFDTRSFRVLATLPVARGAYSVAISPREETVLVVSFEDASVNIINPDTLRVVGRVPVGRAGLTEPFAEWGPGDSVQAIFAGDDAAWVTNFRSGSLARIDLSAQRVDKVLVLPKAHHPCTMVLVGAGRALVGGYGPDALIDLAAAELITSYRLPRLAVRAAGEEDYAINALLDADAFVLADDARAIWTTGHEKAIAVYTFRESPALWVAA